jgi:hypothetical protein
VRSIDTYTLGRSRIADDPCREDMNFSMVHVIWKQCSILPNKENQIPFKVNCNHSVLHITNLVTKFNIVLSKYLQCGHHMLQCTSITTIVFKDPD